MLKLEIIGHLGQDAAVNNVNGNVFISFRVAHTNKYTHADGTQSEETIWVSCTKNGENRNLLPFLKTGTRVFCRGNASVRTYSSAKLRQIVAGVNLNVTELELCGDPKKTESVAATTNNEDPIF